MTTRDLPGQLCPVLLTQKQSATYLNISYSSFRRWRSLAGFPAPFVQGSVIRWRQADLDKYVAAHLRKEVQ